MPAYAAGLCQTRHSTALRRLALQFIKDKYWEYEYEEVVTPNIYNFDLWRQSGHAAHYKENMFVIDVEKQEFGLKPMNCPGALGSLAFLSPFRSGSAMSPGLGLQPSSEVPACMHAITLYTPSWPGKTGQLSGSCIGQAGFT